MRTERLMELLQILRRHKRPASGRALAAEMEISLRTLYRDIAALQGMGADIEGEPGVGYILRPGFFLPPLMLSQDEIEALALGMRWVATFADRPLASAATGAISKIEAVLPEATGDVAGAVSLRVGPPGANGSADEDLTDLRDAIRRERKLKIIYRSAGGQEQERVIWPFAIGYFVDGRILVGWCESRGTYRHFRTDRLVRVKTLAEGYPRRRDEMLGDWRRGQLDRGAGRSSPDRPN